MPPLLDPVSLFTVREVTRLREIDYELEMDLWQVSPQALLRDLHRPETTFGVNPLDFARHEWPTDGGRADYDGIKKLAVARYAIPIKELLDVPRMYSDSIAERRRIMRAPWADTPKLGKQYLPSAMTWG